MPYAKKMEHISIFLPLCIAWTDSVCCHPYFKFLNCYFFKNFCVVSKLLASVLELVIASISSLEYIHIKQNKIVLSAGIIEFQL